MKTKSWGILLIIALLILSILLAFRVYKVQNIIEDEIFKRNLEINTYKVIIRNIIKANILYDEIRIDKTKFDEIINQNGLKAIDLSQNNRFILFAISDSFCDDCNKLFIKTSESFINENRLDNYLFLVQTRNSTSYYNIFEQITNKSKIFKVDTSNFFLPRKCPYMPFIFIMDHNYEIISLFVFQKENPEITKIFLSEILENFILEH